MFSVEVCLCLQIHHANGVIVRIGDVELSVGNAQSTGFIERRRVAVSLARLAGSKKRFDRARFRIEFLDLVIVGVGDQDFVAEARRRPSGCCSRTSSPVPSTSPKSNRSPPTSVST